MARFGFVQLTIFALLIFSGYSINDEEADESTDCEDIEGDPKFQLVMDGPLMRKGAAVQTLLRQGSVTLLLSALALTVWIKLLGGIGNALKSQLHPDNFVHIMQVAGFVGFLAKLLGVDLAPSLLNFATGGCAHFFHQAGKDDDEIAQNLQKKLDEITSKSTAFDFNVLNYQNTREAALLASLARTAHDGSSLFSSSSAPPSSGLSVGGGGVASMMRKKASDLLSGFQKAVGAEDTTASTVKHTAAAAATDHSITAAAAAAAASPVGGGSGDDKCGGTAGQATTAAPLYAETNRVAFVLDFKGGTDCSPQVQDLAKVVTFILDAAARLQASSDSVSPPPPTQTPQTGGTAGTGCSGGGGSGGGGVCIDVVVRVESSGGSVNSYGLAASQLSRLVESPHVRCVTACVDSVAASGGYLVACACDRVTVAPFALVGSIGVYGTMVNANDLAKRFGVRAVELRSGSKKNPISMIGEVTEDAVESQQIMLDRVHRAFKQHVRESRGRQPPPFTPPPPPPPLGLSVDDKDKDSGMKEALEEAVAADTGSSPSSGVGDSNEARLKLGTDAVALAAVCEGDVWLGVDAVSLGLADSIDTSDGFLRSLMRPPPPPTLQNTQQQTSSTGSSPATAVEQKERSRGAGVGSGDTFSGVAAALVIEVRPKEPPTGLLSALRGNLPGRGPTVLMQAPSHLLGLTSRFAQNMAKATW